MQDYENNLSLPLPVRDLFRRRREYREHLYRWETMMFTVLIWGAVSVLAQFIHVFTRTGMNFNSIADFVVLSMEFPVILWSSVKIREMGSNLKLRAEIIKAYYFSEKEESC